MQLRMFATRGLCSLSTYADTYSVSVSMPGTIGRPGRLMESLGFGNEVAMIGTKTS